MRSTAGCVLSLLLAACAPDGPPPEGASVNATSAAWFTEEAAARGLDFRHVTARSDRGEFQIPDSVAGGGALFDADRDGDLDVYLVQGGDFPGEHAAYPNRFYRNVGQGHFRDETEATGTGDTRFGLGCAVGDADGDGYEDLFVANFGPDVLFFNESGRTFQERAAGVAGAGFSTSAAFLDADRDGDLDLWVLDYLLWNPDVPVDCQGKRGGPEYCGPKSINAPTTDHFYRNDGTGTFTDDSDRAGIARTPGTGLGLVAGDFDGDGFADVFVANDGWPDRLWRNRGDGTFEDIAMAMGCAVDESGQRKAGMGVTAQDIDDDGDLDLAVCNLGGETDALYRNEGTYFADRTAQWGVAQVTRVQTRFGMGWLDFDNDGWLDLYQANGCVQRPDLPADPRRPYAEPNALLAGGPTGTFRLVEPAGGTTRPLVDASRGAAFGDVDGDGRIDVLVINWGAAPYLLRNLTDASSGWILFDVRNGAGSVALGATVTAIVTAPTGERRLTRDVRAAYSYCVSNDPRVHLGLGDAAGVTDVRVRWVDGTEERFGDFEGRRVVRLQRGSGAPK
ncbi:MAG: FG-GAP-like repeat-containing protein [Planctomycetota bacterium]